VAEYEAFLLGLQATKDLNINYLTVFGDLELVVKKIKDQCKTKHPLLSAYKNEVWYVIENFFSSFNVQSFPKVGNRMANSLAIVSNNFKPPQNPLLMYKIEVRYKPSVRDNVKHW